MGEPHLHANLSPSGAARWCACPGSLRAEKDTPSRPSSDAAAEGTAAHAVLEYCLKNDIHPLDFEGEYQDGYPVDEGMRTAIQVHYEYVQTYLNKHPGTKAMYEQRVNPGMAMGRDDCWGTADTILLNGVEELVVADYKHGKGVVVEVEDNKQALLYGIGAAVRFNWGIDRVRLVVIQPRAPHADGPVREFTVSIKKLRKWLKFFSKKAKATEAEDAPRVPGDSQCKFCRAAGGCPELAEHCLNIAQKEFTRVEDMVELNPTPADKLTPDELAYVLDNAPLLDLWLRETELYAQALLERGEKIKGQKLVRKRANRRWHHEEPVLIAKLRKFGLRLKDIVNSKVKSPNQIDMVAKARLPMATRKKIQELYYKPEGGLTIAREDDSRPAVESSAASDFAGK